MSDFILSINAGSSSLKFQLIKMPDEDCILSGQFDGKRTALTRFSAKKINDVKKEEDGAWDFTSAVKYLISFLLEEKLIGNADEIYCVGHRVAHGGEDYSQPVLINEDVKTAILKLSKLAPIHNPINLLCIEAFEEVLPKAKKVAVFDTAFHQTLPEEQFLYPLPYTLYEDNGIRKFGFHGISHQYISITAEDNFKNEYYNKVISCHLGSGSSICAIENGRSVATTMGFTPLSGLMMGTRCGDIDPSLPIYLSQNTQMSPNDVNTMMNNASGLLGVSELSDDCRVLEQARKQGDHKAALALQMYSNRVKETIGRYASILGGVDLLVFTGGIGENSALIRHLVTDSLGYLGLYLCEESNMKNESIISRPNSKVDVMVINTNEQLMIAREASRVVG
ncbi:acetate/propionate family kinase [Photobacterium sp. DNB22_13_2]